MRHADVTHRRDTTGRTGVGTSVRRVDVAGKLDGTAAYESDLEREELLYGAVLRTTVPHATVRAVETDAAAAIEGVACVVGRNQLLGRFDDRVRHHGDVLAAVAATDRRTAVRALDSVRVDLDPLEGVFDPRESVRADAPRIHPNNPDLKQHRRHEFTVENDAYVRNLDDYHRYAHGDVERGFADAAVVHEAEYETPRVHHCNLQSHCCLAEWRGDTLHLVETVGNMEETREEVAAVLDVGTDRVVVEPPPTAGSSFGGRSLPKRTLEPVAATLAAETGRPVQLRFGRREEFTAAETRHATDVTVRMGLSAAGDITALSVDLVADTGAYPNGVGHIVLSNARDRPLDLYRIPNYRFEGVSAFTNNPVAGEYRGIGVTQMTAILESHLDELVRRAGLDPLTVRRRNFVDVGYTPPTRTTPIRSCGVLECLERGRERFETLRDGDDDGDGDGDDPTVRRGWGVAAGTHTTGVGGRIDHSEVDLRLTSSGRISALTGAVDLGQGAQTVLAQIVAEETGLPAERVDVRRVPTDDSLDDPLGSVASRTTYAIGAATADAAARLATELRRRAAARLDVDESAVDLADGVAHGPDGSVPIEVVASDGLSVTGRSETTDAPPAYGVHFAEVAADVETGVVAVTTFVPAQDVGFAINPAAVEGQLEGAVAHGLEFALYAELRLEEGVPTNPTLADYSVVSTAEMPRRLEPVLVEAAEASGPYGAKGVGTPSLPPVAPAVLNALRDCLGVRFTSFPVTPEMVVEALREGAGQ